MIDNEDVSRSMMRTTDDKDDGKDDGQYDGRTTMRTMDERGQRTTGNKDKLQ